MLEEPGKYQTKVGKKNRASKNEDNTEAFVNLAKLFSRETFAQFFGMGVDYHKGELLLDFFFLTRWVKNYGANPLATSREHLLDHAGRHGVYKLSDLSNSLRQLIENGVFKLEDDLLSAGPNMTKLLQNGFKKIGIFDIAEKAQEAMPTPRARPFRIG